MKEKILGYFLSLLSIALSAIVSVERPGEGEAKKKEASEIISKALNENFNIPLPLGNLVAGLLIDFLVKESNKLFK